MSDSSIVLSIPPAWSEDRVLGSAACLTTPVAFADLFANARRSLKILAPYVDPTFTSLVAATHAPVRIVTTPAPGRPPRPNPVLERCAAMADIAVRYLNERRDRALIFQMHAKLILADCVRAYVGSANLTDTSANFNLELGLLTHELHVVARLERIFDHIFNDLAVRAAQL